ncbi:MAG: hypothetical protein KGJ94_06585, partial [Xanthomonadaceae bacterium]|nr:hypothetical protein [Xanthomonadaceae bacterium]
MKHLSTLCLAVGLLVISFETLAQAPSQWRDQQLDAINKSESIMRRADQERDLLAQYQVLRHAYAADGRPAFRAIFGQYLSWYQSFIGDYKDAERSFSI